MALMDYQGHYHPRGVDNLVKFWMSDAGFKPFLDNVRQGRI